MFMSHFYDIIDCPSLESLCQVSQSEWQFLSFLMDLRLLDASQTGNTDYLHQLLREDPLILSNAFLLSPGFNPLHVACLVGHVDFAREIVRLKPEFSRELNPDGFSPLHIAAATGNIEIVKDLVQLDSTLCRLEGKDERIPLHSAAIKGMVEVLSAMLMRCPDCIEHVDVRGETALHLAVKYSQSEAAKLLVNWVKEMSKEHVFNMEDEQGNTVLHLAAWKKHGQIVDQLLEAGSNCLEVNARNHTGLTALDLLLIFPSNAGDREIWEALQAAGAIKGKDIMLGPALSNQPIDQSRLYIHRAPEAMCQQPSSQVNSPVEYFKFKKGRDSPGETRSALLVVAVLVATATFQVGVNPPGGVWQDTYIPDNTTNSTAAIMRKAHYAGESVLGTWNPVAFCLFVLFNSLGFSVSLFMIALLTRRFPLQFELQICMVAMYTTYNTALINLSPNEIRLYTILTTSILSTIIPIGALWVRTNGMKVKKIVIDMVHRVF